MMEKREKRREEERVEEGTRGKFSVMREGE